MTKSRQSGAYADDTVILGCNKNAGRETFIELEEQVKKAGLSVNPVSYTHLDVYKRQKL